MKRNHRRITGVLISLLLVFVMALKVIPAQAAWIDEFWDVYSQMEEYGDAYDSEEKAYAGQDETDSASASQNGDSDDSSREKDDSWDGTGDPDSLLDVQVEEDGEYTSKWEVAAYIHEYGKLPDNYITKKEAQKLGWDSSLGNLDEVAPGKSIGGNRFGNYEGALPEKKNREYYECDIDYEGGYRGSKRIIYSDDGLIYYTEDHYSTFEKLWPED